MKDETLLQNPIVAELLSIAKKAADDADLCAHSEFNDDSMEHTKAIAEWEGRAALQYGNSGQVPAGLRLALSNAGIAAPESDDMLFATHEKYVQLLVDWVKERKPFAAPKVPAGYVLAPDALLSDLRDFAHPEIEKYCEMWAGRRDEEFPALRKIIADADALLAAPPVRGGQSTTVPGWTGSSDANAAIVMLDRINTLESDDDDRIEDVKRIIRLLAAAPAASDGWIPVSERMPDFFYSVLVTDEFEDMAMATPVDLSVGDRCAFRMSNGDIFLATHWQTLPDAPKGV
ncbi:MAG: DUF551 domain-containing protein [Enterobacteriaceae bacterium]|nr:DUF551 domain-containing protein [Enterobacteriaceae bacterium]